MPSERKILAELLNLYREKRELDNAIRSLETYQRLIDNRSKPRWVHADDEQVA